MGLFSFLFGGGKKEKAKLAPAAKAARAAAPIVVKAAAAPVEASAPKRIVELTQLKLDYAVQVRAGASAKAYAAACRLASFYKEFGAKGLSDTYRVAADGHFGDWLAEVSRDPRRIALDAVRRRTPKPADSLARTRLAVIAKRVVGPEAAKLIEAHRAFLAKLDGPRGARAA